LILLRTDGGAAGDVAKVQVAADDREMIGTPTRETAAILSPSRLPSGKDRNENRLQRAMAAIARPDTQIRVALNRNRNSREVVGARRMCRRWSSVRPVNASVFRANLADFLLAQRHAGQVVRCWLFAVVWVCFHVDPSA